MSSSASPRATAARLFLAVFLVLNLAVLCRAASIRGVVTDASGAKVTGAVVVLVHDGKPVGSTVSAADGSFSILTGIEGRYFLLVSASSFRQVETPGFYAGQMDSIERNLVLEPEWVRESIVVTATGTPTPEPQTSAATSVLGQLELALQSDLTGALRLMPGSFVVQSGQMGAQGSLFLRGGDSDANKILLDGVSVGDLGGRFDFGSLGTTAIERAEVSRGPGSSLYGADAASGVVSLTTPHGTTSFPSFLFHGDAGNFSTSREELEVAGTRGKLDYLGAFSWLQTANDLPNDQYHVATTAANLGWQPNGSTQIRATLHYGVDATGVPNTWDFYRIADDATEKDQALYIIATVDNQTSANLHQSLRYGLTRKREQYHLWAQSGAGVFDSYGDSFGDEVTITGANGAAVTGRALLDFAGSYPQGHQLVNNRDQVVYQGDLKVTPHLMALAGFQYADEREATPGSSYATPVEWTTYDYRAGVHGDFKNRFYYTLGGDLEHYSSFGTATTPRAGFSWYVLRPRTGVLSGTRLIFNFGDAVREPGVTDVAYSLYRFLAANGGQSTIAQMHIAPLSAPSTRTYEGGVEQAFFGQRLVWRTNFFHNEFGRQIEYVGFNLVPALLPNLTAAQQLQLEQLLVADGAYELSLNTEAYRALGVETTLESGIGKNLFLRGGYTYLDAVVQRSFANDDTALFGPLPTYNSIPIGAVSPLTGARPFRRPPHTGFLSASYQKNRVTGMLTGAFASRSDDSDFLGGYDLTGGNTLLLPNRNLDYGYAKLDLGGSYELRPWLHLYAQAENLAGSRHIGPIGYPSLPFNIRSGLRVEWGKGSGR